jgi:hypothetical protein
MARIASTLEGRSREGVGGAGGAKPPVKRSPRRYRAEIQRATGAPAGAERGNGVPASDGVGGAGGAKPPG